MYDRGRTAGGRHRKSTPTPRQAIPAEITCPIARASETLSPVRQDEPVLFGDPGLTLFCGPAAQGGNRATP
jgi:hypothetical protein